ncbi:class I SAM-dependent methyltransferase [Cognatilysobacter lacus]|uniref:Methyltransferase domain-containing protein n=1 Tax=Cognatilysobacter lacus TaxID=1643323 RepID=A0A5D8ZAV2_9GAMM|nr:methyltransferase domain-containing protein [Lysobacter lacus]TZF91183.1 methyltransferase domain-containing protein [Lysobacter lacus]
MDISSVEYHSARRARITSMIDRAGRGLEIGPSHNPAAPKSAGYNVETVDHTDRAGLLEKYRSDVGINLDNIEDVDHVWTGGSLCELVGASASYDWIIASHVIEHMPDLVYFVTECQALLKPDGVLSLVVPDKRYCFDHLRRCSSSGDVIQAHLERRTRHTPGQVFDHFVGACKLDEAGSWHRDTAGRIGRVYTPEFAQAMHEASRISRDYLDIHAWVFTPSSFRLVVHDLNALGYARVDEIAFTDTRDCEFFIAYANRTSGQSQDRLQLAKQALHEQRQAYFP